MSRDIDQPTEAETLLEQDTDDHESERPPAVTTTNNHHSPPRETPLFSDVDHSRDGQEDSQAAIDLDNDPSGLSVDLPHLARLVCGLSEQQQSQPGDTITEDEETGVLVAATQDMPSAAQNGHAMSGAQGVNSKSGHRKRPTPVVAIKLLDLDELATYIHLGGAKPPTEASRHRLLNPKKRKAETERRSRSGRRIRQRVSYDEDHGSGGDNVEDDDDMDEFSDEGFSSRRATRSMGKDQGPQRMRTRSKRSTRSSRSKSRSRMLHEQRVYSVEDSEDDFKPTRKSTRHRSMESSGSYRPDQSQGEPDEEYWSQEESSSSAASRKVLTNHRKFCERCQLRPADELLERARKRKRSGKKRRIKKDHEYEKTDEELAQDLQGWLECSECPVSYHWGCLPERQKKEVIHAIKEHNPQGPARNSIAIDEFSTFLCDRCAIFPVCSVCELWSLPLTTGDGPEAPPVSDEANAEERDSALGDADADGETDVSAPPEERHKDAAGTEGGGHAEKQVEEQGETQVDKQADKQADKPDEGQPPNGASGPESDSHSEQSAVVMVDTPSTNDKFRPKGLIPGPRAPLKFRCFRCKQLAHYEHLPSPFDEGEEFSLSRLAKHYQSADSEGQRAWWCHMCRNWKWVVDTIIAWRPQPADAKELPREPDEKPRFRDFLPRAYLVKWANRSFRHLDWVPHLWLLTAAPQKLRNFLVKGPHLDFVTDETLAAKGDVMARPTISAVLDEEKANEAKSGHERHKHGTEADLEKEWEGHGPPPDIDAEKSIPIAWSTTDRILDVFLFPPTKAQRARPKASVQGNRIVSPGADGNDDEEEEAASFQIEDGIQPPPDQMVEIDRWESITGRKLTAADAEEIAPLVNWCYIKWDDLQYENACFDTPPPKDSPLWAPFMRGLRRYLTSRRVRIPVLTTAECDQREEDALGFRPPEGQPDCVVGGKLMPFQIEGLQWLLYKHFQREICILADDMGLGKTIQIASFLGYLGSSPHNIYPSLVVVPNSTITNWVREFEKWSPHLRVVPYYGLQAARKVILKYELYHKDKESTPMGLKAHVVLTTYDTLTGADFRVFKTIPRWEVLIVDEGQRLKSDSSLMFGRLKTLNSVHRILLTGTPLNNNIRELFNLLHFLDAERFARLDDLQAEYTDLDEAKVLELHNMIKPYILRRIKADVLRLPPKVEIIVPISMTPAQKVISKRIIQRHADQIKSLMKQRRRKKKAAPKVEAPKEGAGEGEGEGERTGAGNESSEVNGDGQSGQSGNDAAAGEQTGVTPANGGEPMDVDEARTRPDPMAQAADAADRAANQADQPESQPHKADKPSETPQAKDKAKGRERTPSKAPSKTPRGSRPDSMDVDVDVVPVPAPAAPAPPVSADVQAGDTRGVDVNTSVMRSGTDTAPSAPAAEVEKSATVATVNGDKGQ